MLPLCTRCNVSVTLVQVVKNVHRFASCAIDRHVTLLVRMPIQQETEKYGEKHGFGVICVSMHKGTRTAMN